MKFQVVLEEAPEGGYVAQCVEIPGAISQGETVKEAMENIADAIQGVLVVRREKARRRVRSARSRVHRIKTVDVDG